METIANSIVKESGKSLSATRDGQRQVDEFGKNKKILELEFEYAICYMQVHVLFSCVRSWGMQVESHSSPNLQLAIHAR